MKMEIGGYSFEPRNDKAAGSHEKFRRNKNILSRVSIGAWYQRNLNSKMLASGTWRK